MKRFVVINKLDNIMVALEDFNKGDMVNNIKILEDVKAGHKVALTDINEKENVIKYGSPIGHATKKILKGSHVHTHNVHTNLGEILTYEYHPTTIKNDQKVEDKTVNVYKRDNGEFGIRNQIYLIPTVGCINGIVRQMAEDFNRSHPTTEFFDGVLPILHPYGCSQMGDDLVNTMETLQNISLHPNAGGVIVLGLGCENNQLDNFMKTYDYNPERVKFVNLQDIFNEDEVVLDLMTKLYEQMEEKDHRETQPISVLKIGLKCGGSDAFSGISANPLLGLLSDYLIKNGGTTVLTEIPELFGAEHNLLNRSVSKEVFDKLVKVINDFKNYYKSHNQVIYDNPSPGNKEGGITTLEEKSLGNIEKGGISPVVDVLDTTERLKKSGFNIIKAPGNDLVSTTTLAMSGAQIVLFTTGRGTPFGGFVPTIKVSTNSTLFNKKRHWIDFDAGDLLTGTPFNELNEQFVDFIIEIANGKQTKNEINNASEIAIFKDGVTL